MKVAIYDEERKKLNETVSLYEEVIDDYKLQYENVYSLFRNNLDELEFQKSSIRKKITLLEKNINKPYFARIDFKNDDYNKVDVCYIGKVGLTDFDNNVITIDWRAPISSLYYDANVGRANFLLNGETICGNLLLKRQYDIIDRKLLDVRDVDTVSNDDLLKPYLGTNADARLKNIVSTIQKEQNDIIRSNINNNLIVQGVAGSGKTTVALHRIAYLVYNYRDKYDSSAYMVIGPNKFFINYISSILPDLDVQDVPQYDLVEFAEIYLGQKIKINKNKKNYANLVGSLEFKKIIDEYFYKFKESIKDKINIKVLSFNLFDKNEINSIIKDVHISSYDSLKDLVERYVFLLSDKIKSKNEYYLEKLNKFIDDKVSDSNLLELRKERDYIRDVIKKDITNYIRNAFKFCFLNPLNVYKDILNKYNYELDGMAFEDIAPLIYINYKIYGNKDYLKYKHVVIDEAQDYSDLAFYSLKAIIKNATFSIYGDIAQSLYPHRSITSWDSVLNDVFGFNVSIKYLNKSYRTSIEIMNEANKINRLLKLNEAMPVIRHGEEVKYISSTNKFETVYQSLLELKDKGLKSIGIISKNETNAKEIYNYLSQKGIDLKYIDESNQEYTGGICSITGILSKGLEFDGVIITDVTKNNYNIDDVLDMKKLYVSMTRALHNLIIIYADKLEVF